MPQPDRASFAPSTVAHRSSPVELPRLGKVSESPARGRTSIERPRRGHADGASSRTVSGTTMSARPGALKSVDAEARRAKFAESSSTTLSDRRGSSSEEELSKITSSRPPRSM
mmetsp:Transcript_13113/g.35962  ORF Transcript_13113/g.35962 Transcript_13113/m.35962 type:complete len:113 (-) Transcript_13113:389-727(-)